VTAPTSLDQLLAHEAVKATKYAYVRCLDQKRWDEMADLFVPDATADYSGGKYHYEGREAIVAFMVKNMDRLAFHTSHRMHHPEIDLVGPTEATAIWAMEDVNVDAEWDFYLTGAGFYDDRYRLVDGRWLIAHTGYRRTFETIMPMSSVAGMKLTASWFSTGGRSELEVM
jgi:hypothetical protein